MKVVKFTSLMILTLATFAKAQVFAESDNTNIFYVPVDNASYTDANAEAIFQARELEEARKHPESRPAELDPEGNWGPVTDGLQLSIRFKTNIFVIGEPVDALVILRNVTTNKVVMRRHLVPIDFIITKDGSEQAPFIQKGIPWVSGPAALGLPPRRQIPIPVNLDGHYDLSKPGEYIIRATRPLSTNDFKTAAGPLPTNLYKTPAIVSSAPVKIKIVVSRP